MQLIAIMHKSLTLSLQRVLAHRTNMVLGLIMTSIDILASMLVLGAVFTQARSLAGWGMEASILLLGTFQMVSGLFSTFVDPNLSWFTEKVVQGQLDDILLKPVPSVFSASLGQCETLPLLRVLLGLALVAVGVFRLPLTVPGLVGFVVLLVAGIVMTWAIRVMVACLAFWSPGFEPTVLFYALWQFGRYPVTIYPSVLRWLLSLCVPVAFAVSFPAEALVQGFSAGTLTLGLLGAVAFTTLALTVWRAGLRRYTSATS